MNGIVEGIIGGTITVTNYEAFNSLIVQYPDNPDLYYVYADLLKNNFQKQSAASFYEKAAHFSLSSGNLIKAIISQAQKWRLSRPKREEIEYFFSEIDNYSNKNNAFYRFFTDLSLSEKIAFMLNLHIVVIPPKTTIIKPGEIEDSIYFAISGEAKESFYQLVDSKSKCTVMPNRIIREYDIFGKAYPYTEQHKSRSFIETTTQMQLAKLSRDTLRGLCQKYPRIEQGIIKLFSMRTNTPVSPAEIQLRKNAGYPIKVKMYLEVFSRPNMDSELCISGFSKDISVTGVGFILDQYTKELKESLSLLVENFQNHKVKVSFDNGNVSLSIFGKIVRMQEIVEAGTKTLVLGIQFEEMPPSMQGVIFSTVKIFSFVN